MINEGSEPSKTKKTQPPPSAQRRQLNLKSGMPEQLGDSSRFDLIRMHLHDEHHPFGYAQAIRVATNILVISDQITGRCKFPVDSFEDLIAAFGSQNAAIIIRGVAAPLSYFRRFDTREFFPLRSEGDLITKLVIHFRDHRLVEKVGSE